MSVPADGNIFDEIVDSGQPDSGLVDDGMFRRKRRRELGALFSFVTILAVIVWWILTYTVIVPDVVGLDEGEATIRLTATDLTLGDVTTVRSSRFHLGEIAEQGPAGGRRALRGSEVDIAVAKDADGLDSSEVEPGDAAGLTAYAGDVSWGGVSEPEPQPEPRTYSDAYPEPLVPMVQALTEKQAVKKLKAAGYRVSVKYGPNSSGPGAGLIFFQDPSAYTREDEGAKVVIWVSTGGPDTGRVCPVPREVN